MIDRLRNPWVLIGAFIGSALVGALLFALIQPWLPGTSSRAAMAELPQGSRDWIRAQDIMMVSQTAVEEERRNGGRRQLSVGAAAK